MAGSLRVTLRKSPISYTAAARGTVRALGLRRIGQTVEVPDNDATRGMVRAVRFLVEAEPITGPTAGEIDTPAGGSRTSRSRAATRTEESDE